jgi:hypothetical protein
MLRNRDIKSFHVKIATSIATVTAAFLSGLIYTDSVNAVTLVPGDSFYTDISSFRANTNGLKGTSFGELAQLLRLPQSGAPNSFIPLAPTTINGVTFTGTGLSLAYTGGGGMRFPTVFNFGGDYLASTGAATGSDKSISAFLPEGITAVGASLSALQANFPPSFSTNFTISLADGSSQIVSGESVFVGFTSSSNISSVTFSIPGDNPIPSVLALPSLGFAFGYANTATPVPEPVTVIGTLVGGIAAFHIKKKLSSSACSDRNRPIHARFSVSGNRTS